MTRSLTKIEAVDAELQGTVLITIFVAEIADKTQIPNSAVVLVAASAGCVRWRYAVALNQSENNAEMTVVLAEEKRAERFALPD